MNVIANATKIRLQYEETFLKELKRLNVAQREAVETIEGPVLVIAGPGTGKTHILSARIGQILKKTDTHPWNILCLTYTDSGVHAMRKRLLEFIGPESYSVHINTFHSFCNSIVQDNLSLFGLRELEPITDLERLDLVADLLDELPADHILKNLKGERRLYDKKLIDLFSRMKSESWNPEFISEKIDEYMVLVPQQEEFIYKRKQGKYKKGDVKEASVQKVAQKMEQLRAGALLYERYQKMMNERKRYDFADMILWVLQVFEEHPEVLRAYQEQYLYFLIDEFQDTNGAQNLLLQKLIGYWNDPNIFVVGDDDQAIYEFQGARVKNLIDFFQAYSESKPIVLNKNYRSTQQLLDTSKIVVDHNQLRLVSKMASLGIDKDLKAGNPELLDSKVQPKLVAYPNAMHEVADIIEQIEELRRQDVNLNEVAIIYAKHKQGRYLVNLLNKKGIPYQTKKRINVLELPAIRKILTIFQYLMAEFDRPESGEELLYEILHYDFTEIDPGDITRIAVHKAKNIDAPPWREIISGDKLPKGLLLAKPEKLLQVHEFLMLMKAAYANMTLPQLLEQITNRSGLMKFLTMREDKVWQIQVITTFFQFIEEETDKNPEFHVAQLLDIISRMKDNNIDLGLSKTVYSKDGGVQLTSAHSSKGLEFKYVFMIDCGEEWEPGNRMSSRRFAFPETVTLSGPEDGMEASRRLFYVAMTRAKEFLQVSYSQYDKKGKPIRHVRFVDEMKLSRAVAREERFVAPSLVAEAQFYLLQEGTQPEVTLKIPKEEVKELLEGFSLSPTSLCRYLECKLSFYYENVLRVPRTSSEAASYGTSVHNALNWLFERMKASEYRLFPSKEEFIKNFNREMRYQRAHLSKKQFQRRVDLGELRLPAYYDARVNGWHKNVKLEESFRDVVWNGVPLTGTVDKIEFLDKSKLHLVDYKTGAPKTRTTNPPMRKGHKGGDYWRQLIFYKILLENYRNLGWMVVSGEIDYLEIDKNTKDFPRVHVDFTESEVNVVKEQITRTYKGIKEHDFYTGCGKKECKWCQFTLNYAMMDSFRDELAEELDD